MAEIGFHQERFITGHGSHYRLEKKSSKIVRRWSEMIWMWRQWLASVKLAEYSDFCERNI